MLAGAGDAAHRRQRHQLFALTWTLGVVWRQPCCLHRVDCFCFPPVIASRAPAHTLAALRANIPHWCRGSADNGRQHSPCASGPRGVAEGSVARFQSVPRGLRRPPMAETVGELHKQHRLRLWLRVLPRRRHVQYKCRVDGMSFDDRLDLHCYDLLGICLLFLCQLLERESFGQIGSDPSEVACDA